MQVEITDCPTVDATLLGCPWRKAFLNIHPLCIDCVSHISKTDHPPASLTSGGPIHFVCHISLAAREDKRGRRGN